MIPCYYHKFESKLRTSVYIKTSYKCAYLDHNVLICQRTVPINASFEEQAMTSGCNDLSKLPLFNRLL